LFNQEEHVYYGYKQIFTADVSGIEELEKGIGLLSEISQAEMKRGSNLKLILKASHGHLEWPDGRPLRRALDYEIDAIDSE
jgi:hypothetical protein